MRYFGYMIGPEDPFRSCDLPVEKIVQRSGVIHDLNLGGPAALKLACVVMWSCCNYMSCPPLLLLPCLLIASRKLDPASLEAQEDG